MNIVFILYTHVYTTTDGRLQNERDVCGFYKLNNMGIGTYYNNMLI